MTLRRRLALVAGLYVIEGFPMGVFQDLWPVFLRDAGVSLAGIGVGISGLSSAWALKFLWSPLVDRFGERRTWIRGALLAMAAALVLLALFGAERPRLLWLALGVLALASATQDIAIDAYTIGIVERGEEGPANAVRIVAYRGGLLLAGAGLLALAEPLGWRSVHALAALLLLAMALGLRAAPPIQVAPELRRDWRGALRTWARRGHVSGVLGFVLLYRLNDLVAAPMLKPFWVDRGISKAQIALVSTGAGVLATLVGAALGGWAVARLGIGRALLLFGLAALLPNAAYALAAAHPQAGVWPVYAASVAESFTGGLVASAFLAFLMRICERERAAVQYALLTGLYALAGRLLGSGSGLAVETAGYRPSLPPRPSWACLRWPCCRRPSAGCTWWKARGLARPTPAEPRGPPPRCARRCALRGRGRVARSRPRDAAQRPGRAVSPRLRCAPPP